MALDHLFRLLARAPVLADATTSFEILEQHIPTDIESSSQSDQNRKGAAKVSRFDHLQVTGSDAGLFGKRLLRQTSGRAQPAKIAPKNIELFLRDRLHE